MVWSRTLLGPLLTLIVTITEWQGGTPNIYRNTGCKGKDKKMGTTLSFRVSGLGNQKQQLESPMEQNMNIAWALALHMGL